MADEQQPAGDGGMDEIDIELNPVQSEEQSLASRISGAVTPEQQPASLEDAFAMATDEAADNVDLKADAEAQIDESMWEDFFTPNKHVTMASPPTIKKDLSKVGTALAAMRVGIEEAEAILEAHGLTEITEEQAEKMSASERRLVNIVRSLSPIWQTSYFGQSFTKGDWQQSVLHNDTELSTRRVKLDRVADPIIQIRNSLGQGALVQVPLWHTGIWITLRAPSNAELLDLDQQIRMEKATLGRYSNGMAFSNTEVYTTAAYAKFALDHMYAVTYEFDTVDHTQELLSIIKSTDFPQLMYGLLTAMYPDGYPFRQPCVANPLKCDYLDETILSIARLSYTDRDRLTPKQKRMMASRTAKLDRAGLAEYQAEFPFDNRSIKLNKSVTAFLAVPTLADQIDAGYRWVDGIADATNRAFGLKLTEVDRYRHIVRSSMMTSLRQYSHWIERVEIQTQEGLDPNVVDDPVKKDEALEVISGDKSALKLLDDSIMKWIDACSVTVIGLPKSPCPKCQKEPAEDLTKHPHLIPLDIGYVFFTLAGLKIKGIEDAADEA
jgi:hypothetical protein